MQENQDTQDVTGNEEVTIQNNEQQPTAEAPPEPRRLRRNNLKDKFKEKGEEIDKENKPPMSKEDTIKFYEENIPFMKMQDEFEELKYNFYERKVKNLELQVREIEAIGYLSQWKAGQDDAQRKHDHEQKMKEEWDKMSDGEKAEYTEKAKVNMKIMEIQAKNKTTYDGGNAHEIMMFVTGEPKDPITVDSADKKFCFQIPGPNGFTELCMMPDQTISRNSEGEFIIS